MRNRQLKGRGHSEKSDGRLGRSASLLLPRSAGHPAFGSLTALPGPPGG